MNVMRMNLRMALACAMCVAMCAALSADDAQLDRAKELYRTAAYDEALGVLDAIRATAPSTDALEVNEYRVFCLVALDRKDDARNAIAALDHPRIRFMSCPRRRRRRASEPCSRTSASRCCRLWCRPPMRMPKRHLTGRIRSPRAGFERVLTLLRDPELSSNSELGDLAVVAAAFRDLSAARELAAAAAPPPAAARDNSAAAESAARGKSPEPPVYRDGAPNLVPPAIITQTLPPTHLAERRLWTGAIEVLIDETGKVLSARMAMPVQTDLRQAAPSGGVELEVSPCHERRNPGAVHQDHQRPSGYAPRLHDARHAAVPAR